MSLSADSLNRLAAETGFRVEFLEKVDRLLSLLQALFRDPFLENRLALKGGTALNLFHFDLPRLSVDIDLNYIGALDRELMMVERPQVEQRIHAIAARQDLMRTRAPGSHAGSKWRFRYNSVLSGGGTLEVDLNYLYRQPLWPVVRMDSRPLGSLVARGISVLDLHELAGGKLSALFNRTAARDLFDAHYLLKHLSTEPARLRLAFVLYGAMGKRDWRTIDPSDIQPDYEEASRQLFPLLVRQAGSRRENQRKILAKLTEEVQQELRRLLPLSPTEHDFIAEIRDRGKIAPGLLSIPLALVDLLPQHPALKWRAQAGLM